MDKNRLIFEEDGQLFSYKVGEDGKLSDKTPVTSVEALEYLTFRHLAEGGLPTYQVDKNAIAGSVRRYTDKEFYQFVRWLGHRIENESGSDAEYHSKMRQALTHPTVLKLLLKFESKESLQVIWPEFDEIVAMKPEKGTAKSMGGGQKGGNQDGGPPTARPPAKTQGQVGTDKRGTNPNADSTSGGEPLLLSLGEFEVSEVDLEIVGVGLDIEFRRTYRHRTDYPGPFGEHWDHSYNLWLREAVEETVGGGRQLVVYRSTGDLRMDRFVVDPEGAVLPDDLSGLADAVFVPASGSHEILAKSGGAYVLSSPDGSRVEYNVDLRAERLRDRNGNAIELKYDDEQLIAIIDTCGREIRLEYDAEGRICALKDASLGRATFYGYGTSGALETVASETGRPGQNRSYHQFRYWGDAAPAGLQHNLVARIDENGRTGLSIRYGTTPGAISFNRVVWQFDGGGLWEFSYEDAVPITTDPGIAPHDVTQTIVTSRSPDGVFHRYEFNSLGRMVSYCVRRGAREGLGLVEFTYRYNIDGRVVREERPEGGVVEYRYGREIIERSGLDPEAAPPEVKRTFGELRTVVEHARPASATPPLRITEFEYDPARSLVVEVVGPFYANMDESPVPGTVPFRKRVGYDALGNLERISYPDCTLPDGAVQVDRRIEFRVDARGRTIERRIPMGTNPDLVTRYEYFADPERAAYIERETRDAEGLAQTRTMEWDAGGRMIRLREPDGLEVARHFDHSGLVLSEEIGPHVAGGAPGRTAFGYDCGGRVVTTRRNLVDEKGIEGAVESIRNVTYDCFGQVRSVSDETSDGDVLRRTELRHDPMGRLCEARDPRGVRTRFRYGSTGVLSSVRQAVGTDLEAATTQRHDFEGMVRRTLGPLGIEERIEYDGFGRVARRELANGTVETFEWDAHDRLTQRILEGSHPDSAGDVRLEEIRQEYDEGGRLVRRIQSVFVPDAAGEQPATTQWTYDRADRVVLVESPEGASVELAYDGLGRIVKQATGTSGSVEWVYDTVQRSVVEKVTAKSAIEEATFETTSTFDPLGNPLTIEDELSNRREFLWDSRGQRRGAVDEAGVRMSEVRGPSGEVLERHSASATPAELVERFSYEDPSGDWTRLDGPRGGVLEIERDLLGREAIRTRAPDGPQAAEHHQQYDAAGRLVETTDENGLRTTFTYDAMDNVERVDFDRGNLVLPAGVSNFGVGGPADATFEYDGMGRLIRADAGGHVLERRFDSRGLLSRESVDGLGPSFEYDLDGRRTAIVYPGGRRIQTVYGDSNQVVQVFQTAAGANHPGDPVESDVVAVTPLGIRGWSSRTLTGGVAARASRDPAGRLVRIVYATQAGDALLTVARVFDRRGVARIHQEETGGLIRTEILDSDAKGHLTSVRVSDVVPVLAEAQVTGSSLASAHQSDFDALALGVANAVMADPASEAVEWILDADGARQRVDRSIGGTTTSSDTYVTDDLAAYRSVAGTLRTHDRHGNLVEHGSLSYRYDQAHRLVEIRDGTAQILEIERDPVGRPLRVVHNGVARRYVFDGILPIEIRDDDDQVLTQLAYGASPGDLVQVAEGGQTGAVLTDFSGSARLVVHAGGIPTSRRYGPYGEATPGELALPGELGFHGFWQVDTQLPYVLGHRSYDPDSGSFLQPDPLGVVDGPNPYLFSRGNPYSWTDLQGLSAQKGRGHGSGSQGRERGSIGEGGPGGGGEKRDLSWWERGLAAMGGAIYAFANIFVEAGKQVWDLGGLSISTLGVWTDWWDYDHDVASGIGQMADQGMGTGDIFKGMGRNLIETPGRFWDAAERGDWFSFGSESMNLYMIGRSAHGLARGTASFAFNRGVGALGRLGQTGQAWRTGIRNWQVGRIATRTQKMMGSQTPSNITWRYGGSSRSAYGNFNRGTNTINIFEGSFVPKLTYRLPSLSRGNPYFIGKSLGWSRLLRGRSTYTTPVHEAWHATQFAQNPTWYTSARGGNYATRAIEFTQPGQPFPGAHNYAFTHAPPSPLSIALGTGSVLFSGGASEETE